MEGHQIAECDLGTGYTIEEYKRMVPTEPKMCRLDSGEIVLFDVCNEGKRSRTCEAHKETWEYLGEGVIHSIGGMPQPGNRKYHFYGLKIR